MGRNKSDVKRMAVYRSFQVQEQTNAWLVEQRASQAASRSAETTEQTQAGVEDCRRWEYAHLWGFLPFGVHMLFVVPNPVRPPTTAIHGHERRYRSVTTQMDLCQLVSVTSEWRYSDYINSVTFLKLVFQTNTYKVK